MAIYRQVYMKFWNEDSKVVEDFTPEDKYFYLYLLTNPHTSLTGCSEISDKTMARETGYNEETIKRLRERMEKVHHVICYEPSTKEVLILNWHKYNWTSSDKLITAVLGQLKLIKCPDFRAYVEALANGDDTVSIPYPYRSDTTITITNTNNNKTSNRDILLDQSEITDRLKGKVREWLKYKSERRESYKEQGIKSLLTQIAKNEKEYGTDQVVELIDTCMANGWKGIIWEKLKQKTSGNKFTKIIEHDYDFDDLERKLMGSG